jgi:putative transposase
MPFIRIWIHLVWSTKSKELIMPPDIRKIIFSHIKENAKKKKIKLDCINGYTEHVHCLISLGASQTISKVAQLLKGESSFWINEAKITDSRFEWQDEYFAASVSESDLEKVRNYIKNQEKRHKNLSFDEEYESLIMTKK